MFSFCVFVCSFLPAQVAVAGALFGTATFALSVARIETMCSQKVPSSTTVVVVVFVSCEVAVPNPCPQFGELWDTEREPSALDSFVDASM